MKKIIKLIIITTSFSLISLSGCMSEQEYVQQKETQTKTITEAQPVTVINLESVYIYNPQNQNFYKIATPDYLDIKEKDNSINEENAYKNSVIAFNNVNDCIVPTMYKDDLLVYYTYNPIQEHFNMHKYLDYGYSVGLFNLYLDEHNMYTFQTKDNYIVNNLKSIKKLEDQYLNDDNEKDYLTLTFKSIFDEKKNDVSKVSENGILTGLEYNKKYNIEVFLGSLYFNFDTIADTHFFNYDNVKSITSYYYTNKNYIYLDCSELNSGYYYLENKGFFRYYNINRGENTQNINLNEKLFVNVSSPNPETSETPDISETPNTKTPINTKIPK